MDLLEGYRKTLLTIAGNRLVEKLSVKYGKRLARRFIAGDTLAEALAETEQLNRKGIMVTLDHLGEGIERLNEAAGYREQYIQLLSAISERQVDANVSLKPTQMGLSLNAAACYRNIRDVVLQAKKCGNFVRIDMEHSGLTQATIDMVLKLHDEGLTNVGTVLQAYLRRTEKDARELMENGVNLRLVKGAYKEPESLAFQRTEDVIEHFKTIIRLHLDQGVYTAVASHDDRIIEWVKRYTADNGIGADAFEFQMLYGLRTNAQEQLAADGYRIRCYMPYGVMWYPYYTRRLAEKPANLLLVLKHAFH
ncbi:proline dehydrogenase family protein [Paenibacillus sp. NPDC058071]|uniref:proline dehydrogenase family protein n=1 Tax=Paenibacillus sp. NPDC058071 TaxID=3346326 RepID=UPI0036D9B27F